ncbi:MFS general substrate transporter [Lanmaoa asiatica]|nr:MFS general substrate transporter [Lanmaoa asiatica]
MTFEICTGLVYPPCILYMSEWFFKRRGLANGILFSGTPVGGLVMPFVLPPLVKAYGLFMALRTIAIALLVLLFPCLTFIRPRLPDLQVHTGRSVYPIAASSITLRNRAWWTLLAANVFQGFAFFVPLIYIPADFQSPVFSSTLNLDSALSSLAIALLNGFSSAGPILVGFLSDYFTPWPIAFILSTLSLLCTVVFWGVIGDVVGVMLFSVTYGFVASGWSTLWSSFVRQISREDPSLSMSMYGILMLTRGLGNVLSTPVSTALAPVQSLSTVNDGGARQGFALDDGRFACLIAYIGVCYSATMLVSVVGWVGKKGNGEQESGVCV